MFKLGEVETWYMPLMSRTAADQWKRFFYGNKTGNDKPWSEFCGQEEFVDPIAVMKGFGETQIVKCYFDPKTIGAWNTTYWSDKMDGIEKGGTSQVHNFGLYNFIFTSE
jgi:hypothetical protein